MKPGLFIGLISGTSRDGIDAVLVDFEDKRPDLLTAQCVPYPPALRADIDRLISSASRPGPESMAELDRQLGWFYASVAEQLVRETGLVPGDVTALGSHGQTVWHEPEGTDPVSIQLGNGEVIATASGVCTVSDFRSADIEAGGQGAPLAPLLHECLFENDSRRSAIVNLGGIANVTLLAPGEATRGFDCGPANCLMDLWTSCHKGTDYDEDGSWAASGEVNPELLARFLKEPYFARVPPKSTGLELFNGDWLSLALAENNASERDVQRTLLELTSLTVTQSLRDFRPDSVLVCGGGVHNSFLMARLSECLEPTPVESTSEQGVNPDWIEACLFAWLARERLMQRPQNLQSITGSTRPVMLGTIHQPREDS